MINLWFSLQAASDGLATIDDVNALLQHEAFDMKNPNKVRSVIAVFAGQNLRRFHAKDGKAYMWLAERIIELDALNPQIASRLVGPLTKWRRLAIESSQFMRQALEKVQAHGKLSKDVYEVVSKSLVD